MRSIASLFSAAALLTSALVSAHNIQLNAHARECFFETLHKEDRMSVTFQVGDREFGGAGNLDVDFWIQDPAGSLKVSERGVSSGTHSFDAALDGRYTYCFSNENSNVMSKEVAFNVHGVVYVAEDPSQADPLEREVKVLGELLNEIKDEQEYIVIREQVHRNTAESTNSRVKWWSIFQLGVVGGNGVFQVWYLKRFFEVKRVV
ncbi:p24 complex component [Maublancomyces gigas]|uniref:P24 complex component n=1 Tax=Discina gigas TaxID=1032678 RepID=A0ABR3GD37_9PEZI